MNLFLIIGIICITRADLIDDADEEARKILGSSVVTSVSVVKDPVNASKATYTDAVGRPLPKPQLGTKLASPIELLNPDRYEFYTFDDSGDLVKRLMTMDEIKGIIATSGDDAFTFDNLSELLPEKKVSDIVSNVQNVLKEEIETHKMPDTNQLFDTPDVSDTWSMILPAIFGNSGEEIKPEKTVSSTPPETIVLTQTDFPEIQKMSTKLTRSTERPSSSTNNESFLKLTTHGLPLITKDITKKITTTTEKVEITKSTTNPAVKISKTTLNPTTKPTVKPLTSSSSQTIKPFTPKVEIFPNSQILEEPASKISSDAMIHESTKATYIPSTPAYISALTQLLKSTAKIKPNSQSLSTTLGVTLKPKPTTTNSILSTKYIKTTTKKPSYLSSTKLTTEKTTLTPSTVQLKTNLTPNQQIATTVPIFHQTKPIQFTVINSPSPSTMTYNQKNNTTQTNKINEALNKTLETKNPIDTIGEGSSTEYISVPTKYYIRPINNNFTLLSSLLTTPYHSTLSVSAEPVKEFGIKITTSTKSPVPLEINSETRKNESINDNIPANHQLVSPTSPMIMIFNSTSPISTTEKITTKFESILLSHTENNTLADSLEKLLLSANNIYDINLKLTEKSNYIPGETTTNLPETTTLNDSLDVEINAANLTLVQSIEQLLAQAVSNISEVIIDQQLMNTLNSTQHFLEAETSTLDPTTFLTESTLRDISTPEYEFIKVNNEADYKNSVAPFTSTTDHLDETQTTLLPTTTLATTKYPELDESGHVIYSSTIIPLSDRFNDNPHFLNITIIRRKNHTALKPAKADLSQEIEDLKLISNANTEAVDKFQLNQINYYNTEKIDATTDSNLLYVTQENTENTDDEKSTTFKNEKQPSLPNVKNPLDIISNTFKSGLYKQESVEENTWTLVSTISPHSKLASTSEKPTLAPILESSPPVDLVAKPLHGFGLEDSTSKLDTDVYQFVQLCNELAFGFWKTVTTGISSARSVIVSPFAATSILAMVFLGARGATSGEMNEILKLDNMVTFNPHLIFKNVTESIQIGPEHGIALSSITRQLFSDKSKEKILNFYKERARFFYDGHVEEVDFTDIADTIRRRTNLLVKKHTGGKVGEFIKENTIKANPPLAAMSANIFQTDCTKGYVRDRDGELHFIVLPSIRQRRLIPIPAVVYKDGFLAGYEPSLDATAVALGEKEQVISTIFVLPGRPGITPPGDSLSRLEKRLVESSFQKGAWSRLLRSLIPRDGLEIQIPRFSHRSIINATESLKQIGLKNLFDTEKADLRGLNGVAHELHLSEMLQVNSFSVCRYGNQPDGQHTEFYPATASRSLRKQRLLEGDATLDDLQLLQDPIYATDYLSVPLPLRPRQARVPQIPRLKLDRPFLYFVRHNPSGLILHMGRFNPRLLP